MPGRTAADDAEITEKRLVTEVAELERGHATAAAELSGLFRSDAYKRHEALVARRDHVASLESQAGTLENARDIAYRRLTGATAAVATQR
ncbi:MAG: hypothetical protein WCC65_11345, partial [Pseudonocardiaceae bacterium]